jgi:multidrug efflux pump subunit AcrA (membrane-fusion protein)
MSSWPVAILLLACVQDKPAPAAEEEVVAAQKGNLTPTLELDVTFESIETAEIKPRMETYQGELMVVKLASAGQAVKKGEPVLVLDRTPIERLIAAAEIDLRVARASLEKAEAEMKLGEKSDALALLQAETAVRDAETTLRAYEEIEGKHYVLQAELQVKYGEDGIKDQQEELDQLLKMYKTESLTNATAEIVVRRTQRALERSKVALEMSRAEYKLAKDVKYPQQRQTHVFGVDTARRSLESLKAQQALSKVQREAELAKAKAAVTQILHDFGWPKVVDFGPISAARWLEALCIIWVYVCKATGSWQQAFKILSAQS